MRAPFSFLSPGRLACLALLAPAFALAQNPPQPAFAAAADPAAPTAPLVYQGMAPRPSQALQASQAQQLGAQDWRAANAAVGQFPRGHADIVAWEAAQAKAASDTASTVPTAPPATPMQHPPKGQP